MKTYQTPQSPYGAFELKRLYQRHMLRGILISSILILAFFYTYGHLDNLQASDTSVRNLMIEKGKQPVSDRGTLWQIADNDTSETKRMQQHSEKYPRPDEFVAFEEPPVLLNQTEIIYPEEAKKAGIEGTVWIQALVDENGDVVEALILKDSGTNAGFEKEALKKAFMRSYRPALQNTQPVSVWVAYKVQFKLNH